ncbi:LytTR family DNA-binding domain-containing protein [Ekhidna sp.]|uniref:LytR/AlgR family response regulator transcription factor n=1 Tax=Ekhidna sp. TaxID=2608089 RepID=UPI00329864A8
MNLKRPFVFWIVIWILLTIFLSTSLGSLLISFFFVTFLMPVIVSTSLFFNRYLLPRYLMKGDKLKFGLYLFYMLVVSIYLELLVMILAFVILADYQVENLGKIAGDIYLLTAILYLIVLIEGLILSVQNLRESAKRISLVEQELLREKEQELMIRVDRQNVLIRLDEIQFIESLSDYVRIYTDSEAFVTKEKISSFEDRLPSSFIRIHRSFIVNRPKINSFNKEQVRISETTIPIGRKYKKTVEQAFTA